MTLALQAIPPFQVEENVEKPNLTFIIANQRHYGLSKAIGNPHLVRPIFGRQSWFENA